MSWLLSFFFIQALAQEKIEKISAKEILECSSLQTSRLNREQVLQSQETLSDSRQIFRPTVGLSPQYGRSTSSGVSGHTTTYSLSVQQPILNAGQWSRIDALGAELKANQQQLNQTSLDISLKLLAQLVARQNLIEQIKLSQVRKQNYEELVRSYSVANRAGLISSIDLMQAKSAVLTEDINLHSYDFDLTKQEQEFRIIFGLSAFDLSRLSIADGSNVTKAIAIEHLPGIRSLRFQLQEAQLTKRQREREFWPTLALSSQYSQAKYTNDYYSTPSSDLTFSISLDLSGILRDSGAKEAASAQIKQRENILQQQTQQIQNVYQQIDAELALLVQQLPILQQRVDIAQKAQEVGRVTMRLGKISFVELQQVEQTFSLASQDLVNAQLRNKELHLQKEISLLASQPSANVSRCRLP